MMCSNFNLVIVSMLETTDFFYSMYRCDERKKSTQKKKGRKGGWGEWRGEENNYFIAYHFPLKGSYVEFYVIIIILFFFSFLYTWALPETVLQG